MFCCIENRIQNYQGMKIKNKSFVLCAVLTGNSKNKSSMLFRVSHPCKIMQHTIEEAPDERVWVGMKETTH